MVAQCHKSYSDLLNRDGTLAAQRIHPSIPSLFAPPKAITAKSKVWCGMLIFIAVRAVPLQQ